MRAIAVMSALRCAARVHCHCRHATTLASESTLAEVECGYESVIGLEVHTQIASATKLFSPSGTSYTSPPNSQVSHFDCALPGTLPVLNRRCVEAALATGLALNCHIHKRSAFDRKHYFYADMPNGYQITQQRHPLATDGFIEFIAMGAKGAYIKRSKLKQIQLEQDSGKSLQDDDHNVALVDLNRAGVGLIEFVFEPDLNSADEAVGLVRELILILKALETSTCKMNEGVLRVDANISVNKPGQPFGVRTEVKNLNSLRFIHSAIEHEIKRQIELLDSGGQVGNETRRFNQKLKQTVVMRDKEVVQDYRFMPEPNIPPILLCDDNDNNEQNLINIMDIQRKISSIEMPNHLRNKLSDEFDLKLYPIFVLMNNSELRELFFKVCQNSRSKNFNIIFKFLNFDLKLFLEELKLGYDSYASDPIVLSQITDLLAERQISSRIANRLLRLYSQNERRNANEIVIENDWNYITDKELIERHCLSAIETNPKVWRKYSQTRVKKARLALIEHVMNQLDHRLSESDIWKIYDRLLDEWNNKTNQ